MVEAVTEQEIRIVKRYESRLTDAVGRADGAELVVRNLEREVVALRGKVRNLEMRHAALQTLWRGLPPELHEVA